MNIKLLLATTALGMATGLSAYTVTLVNHTSQVVGVIFPVALGVDPQGATINPNESTTYNSKVHPIQGIYIKDITLPSNRIIGGSQSNPALKETFTGRPCGFTWHLFSEEKSEPKALATGFYTSTPTAIRYYLVRKPCGGIGGSMYPGGVVAETEWLDPASGKPIESEK
jgi:hypothetical protein